MNYASHTKPANTKEPLFENREQLLSINQLADHLTVSPKTIYGWIYKGLIPFVRIGPRVIRFDRRKIDEWILQNQKEP